MHRLPCLWGIAACGCFVVPPPPLVDTASSESSTDAASEATERGSSSEHDTESGDASSSAASATSASEDDEDGDDDGHGTSGDAIDCAPMPPGIVAWWRGDGDMMDSVGGVAANAVGGLDASAPGYVDEAFHFDGVDDALAIEHASIFSEPSDEFTVEAWVRLDALEQPRATDATVLGDMEIVGKMAPGETPNADGWRLFKQTDADELWFCVGALDNGCRPDAANTVRTGTAAVETWLHVAAVRDGDRIAIHLGGELVDESLAVAAIDTSIATLSIGASTAEVRNEPAALFTSFYFGTIDEVTLYDRALALDEIAALASSPGGKCR